ncbi:MAG: tripartite tricarboxylate transporter TctB family protein [Eubacteriales bacterium]|nr:tripartite tricarboxylate transporter TctB family protein [Eubacteriales bacterium]
MNKKLHRDVFLGIILAVFCFVCIYLSLQIKGDAKVVPTAISALMAVCSLIIIANGLKATPAENGEYPYAMKFSNSKYAWIFMALIVGYFFMFKYIAYWIATPIFLIVSQKYLKVKSWKVNLLITVIYTVLCYIMFVIILKLPIYRIGILGRFFRYV